MSARVPMIQLNPPIRLQTPFGAGQAIIYRVESDESDMIWTVVLEETGIIVDVPNHKVAGQRNWTQDRKHPQKPQPEKLDDLTGHA